MGIARVASRAQLGLAAPRVDSRSSSGQWAADIFHRGFAGNRGEGKQGSRARGTAELRLRISRGTHHRQPLARGSPQGRLSLRPAHRARHPAGLGAGRIARRAQLERSEFYGELGLAGELKPIRGVLLAAAHASARAAQTSIVPAANLDEARLASPRSCAERAVAAGGVRVCSRAGTQRLCATNPAFSRSGRPNHRSTTATGPRRRSRPGAAKRALLVAAAGAHSILLVGPPGTGKSMLAQRLPGLLPPLAGDEALDVASIASVSARGFDPQRLRPASVSRAASQRIGQRHHRRRTASPARRGQPRASRRVVPRRVAGVQSRRARIAARAAGNRRGRDLAGRAAGGVPGALSAGGGDESLSVRISRRQLPVVAAARRRKSRAIARASPGHCSIASICASRCRLLASDELLGDVPQGDGAASAAAAGRVRDARRRAAGARRQAQRGARRRRNPGALPARSRRRRLLVAQARERLQLSARGMHRAAARGAHHRGPGAGHRDDDQRGHVAEALQLRRESRQKALQLRRRRSAEFEPYLFSSTM